MSEPAPLPPTRDDPAVQAATATQDPYVAKVEAIRSDSALSELAKAEQLSEAYEQQIATLNQHFTDLQTRRTARRDHLAAKIPAGPGTTPDMSPADQAVLQAAFRARLEEVGNSKLQQRQAMLAEAVRYGDDTTIRAVVTHANDHAENQTIDAWAQHTGNEAVLAEMRDLNAKIGGQHFDRTWEGLAFRAPRRPMEAANIPALRKQAEEAEQAEARRRRFNPGVARY